MLDFHKKNGCDVTIAVLEVTMEEASRFGIMNADENDKIYEFEEKPEHPKSNLASMGIYIFSWQKLRAALIEDNKVHADSDFGKHIIPMMLNAGEVLYAYRFKDYWKDVGTIESYWAANMGLSKQCQNSTSMRTSGRYIPITNLSSHSTRAPMLSYKRA